MNHGLNLAGGHEWSYIQALWRLSVPVGVDGIPDRRWHIDTVAAEALLRSGPNVPRVAVVVQLVAGVPAGFAQKTFNG